MKGYLQKTEEGWFVIYDQRTMQDPSAEDGTLPLHPKNASFLDMNLTSTTFFNKKIEFEEINLVDKLNSHQNCVFKTYAQFITTDNYIFDTNKIVDQVTNIEKLAEEQSKNQALMEYEIRIKFLSRGCIVSVGCKEIAFENTSEALAALNLYMTNPWEEQKKWNQILDNL